MLNQADSGIVSLFLAGALSNTPKELQKNFCLHPIMRLRDDSSCTVPSHKTDTFLLNECAEDEWRRDGADERDFRGIGDHLSAGATAVGMCSVSGGRCVFMCHGKRPVVEVERGHGRTGADFKDCYCIGSRHARTTVFRDRRAFQLRPVSRWHTELGQAPCRQSRPQECYL